MVVTVIYANKLFDCRERNYQIRSEVGDKEQLLHNPYKYYHSKLIARSEKCLHRHLSTFRFKDKCTRSGADNTISVHNYTYYSDQEISTHEEFNDKDHSTIIDCKVGHEKN